jgi:hypothetical protein
MNAYEMADELLRDNTQLTVKAAYMLRQQANRIRNLEKTLGFKNSGYETINLTPMPEPVAWFDGEYYVCPELGYEYTITEQHPKDLGWIPLYTTPQIKELSDEEIWEVIDNCFGVHAFNLDYQIALDEAREDAFDLVKTVLKKASEK